MLEICIIRAFFRLIRISLRVGWNRLFDISEGDGINESPKLCATKAGVYSLCFWSSVCGHELNVFWIATSWMTNDMTEDIHYIRATTFLLNINAKNVRILDISLVTVCVYPCSDMYLCHLKPFDWGAMTSFLILRKNEYCLSHRQSIESIESIESIVSHCINTNFTFDTEIDEA